VTIRRSVAFAGANWRRHARSTRIRQCTTPYPKRSFPRAGDNALDQFLQIFKPA